MVKFEFDISVGHENFPNVEVLTLDDLNLTEEEWNELSDVEQDNLLYEESNRIQAEFVEVTWGVVED